MNTTAPSQPSDAVATLQAQCDTSPFILFAAIRGPSVDTEEQASVRRAGRTMGVVDVDVLDTAGRLVATGRGTFFLEAKA